MLQQILSIGPFAVMLLLSAFVSLIITLIYKYTTDQKAMAAIKADMDRLRKDMKGMKDPKKMGEINQQLMQKTMEQFRASMKPMIITLLPALLVLGWMQGNIAYQQIAPGEEFTTTATFEKGASGEIELHVTEGQGMQLLSEAKQKAADKVSWKLKGQKGTYELEYAYNSGQNSEANEIYTREVAVTEHWEYRDPLLEKGQSFLGMNTGDKYPIKKDSQLKRITIDNKPIRPFGQLSLFGWEPGWLGAYIILSLIFSLVMRAVLKVH
ncbi:DUF106 domain-containing protein [Candidatus Woesearchaeota archaeon]|nr:DUF106 domain-containing protein [Candidatus Woesearchaeota archaeon]